MKDALGHGSDGNNGTHSAPINNLPGKGAPIMSDATWHAQMPPENYSSQIGDLLGLWNGTQKSAPLSPAETDQVNKAYAQRADWRAMAARIHEQRSVATRVAGR